MQLFIWCESKFRAISIQLNAFHLHPLFCGFLLMHNSPLMAAITWITLHPRLPPISKICLVLPLLLPPTQANAMMARVYLWLPPVKWQETQVPSFSWIGTIRRILVRRESETKYFHRKVLTFLEKIHVKRFSDSPSNPACNLIPCCKIKSGLSCLYNPEFETGILKTEPNLVIRLVESQFCPGRDCAYHSQDLGWSRWIPGWRWDIVSFQLLSNFGESRVMEYITQLCYSECYSHSIQPTTPFHPEGQAITLFWIMMDFTRQDVKRNCIA